MEIKKLFKSWLLIALGVVIAAHTTGGIHYESGGALLVAVLLLSVLNLVLKPLLMLFSLPFIILTFGVGIWLINALLFMLVGFLVVGFEVASFWNALWGALVVSLTGAAANVLFGGTRVDIRTQRHTRVGTSGSVRGPDPGSAGQRRPTKKDDDDVIDV
ncbi:MAG: phage holin family protein [Opitutales bacterium]